MAHVLGMAGEGDTLEYSDLLIIITEGFFYMSGELPGSYLNSPSTALV